MSDYYVPSPHCERQSMLDVNLDIWQRLMSYRPAFITGDATPTRATVKRPIDKWYGLPVNGFPVGAALGRDDQDIWAGRPGANGATVEELTLGIPEGTFYTIRRTWARRDHPIPERWEERQ